MKGVGNKFASRRRAGDLHGKEGGRWHGRFRTADDHPYARISTNSRYLGTDSRDQQRKRRRSFPVKERTALGEAILTHWREHCPQMVQELEKRNRLDQAVFEAQEKTTDL